MTFPAYPAYKNSGVQWIGSIPEHWCASRLRNIFFIQKRIAGKLGFDVLSITNKGVKIKDVESGDGQLSSDYSKYQLVMKGEFAMNHMDLVTGYVDISEFNGVTSPDYRVFSSVHPELDNPRFMLRLLQNAYHQKLFFPFGQGSAHLGRWRLPAEEFKDFFFPRPSRFEQTQIARFLDHKTARIDALIEEQQRLIELLKEKRQAVISHAVTKGLDPTVPMKDSGVEWLGDVPTHWVVCATRRAIRFIEQGWSPECESYPAEEDGWGVLKAGCVNRGFFDASENKTLPSTLKPIPEYEVRAGDILMSRASGSPELVGSTALLGQVRERLMLSDKIFRIHLEEKVSNQFFVWVMNAQFMRSQIEQALSGGNGLANNLPQSSLLAFWLAIPPEHEQCAIAELINEQTGRIDELIVEGDVAVELLQERRSALISAAVTGKIDVRCWQPPARAQSPELEEEAV